VSTLILTVRFAVDVVVEVVDVVLVVEVVVEVVEVVDVVEVVVDDVVVVPPPPSPPVSSPQPLIRSAAPTVRLRVKKRAAARRENIGISSMGASLRGSPEATGSPPRGETA
jgi:hypothetical protein